MLLPAQLFFFIGGVIGSRLLVRKIFVYQAITPLIYNLGIIVGAVLFHRQFGIYSLAIGVLAGVILVPRRSTSSEHCVMVSTTILSSTFVILPSASGCG